ncbi:uncharacterized protein LOC141600313 [Silene latifolia]|uniref:uncharacterized protein LOC141600313 n=1 Tax=Silene latifolia TaxID=37657 RepID=UPI003D7777FA
MESTVLLPSFHCSAGGISHALSSLEKRSVSAWLPSIQSPDSAYDVRKTTASFRSRGVAVACAKTPEAIVSSKSNIPLDNGSNSPTEKCALRATFPNAFEALLLEVCDETSVAELQLKIGDYEMHLKRNVGATNVSIPMAPPVPSEPMEQSTPIAASTSATKSSSEKASPFSRAASVVSTRLASLEASGVGAFKIVASPTVGSFQRGRTVKGKKQPPVCKKGDVIKEGQVIGYVDRFGNTLPVKSDVAGEVLKLLFEEGEAVGYGDPLVAVLPSFHGLN